MATAVTQNEMNFLKSQKTIMAQVITKADTDAALPLAGSPKQKNMK
jgi:hypothetical protein